MSQPFAVWGYAAAVILASGFLYPLRRNSPWAYPPARKKSNDLGRTIRHRTTDFQRTPSDKEQMRLALQSIEIRRSRIHGRGLFARRDIDPETRLIQYVGRRIPKEYSDRLCLKQNAYIFRLNEQEDVDGKVSWNPARFINHSCGPNCDAELDDRDRIWVVSRRAILRGEELTWNYGYDLKDFMNFPCSCGAPTCLGYMVAEELFPTVRRLLPR